MPPHRTIGPAAYLLMLALCASWGLQQVTVKWALVEVPVLAQAAIRSIGGGLLLWLWAKREGTDLSVADGTLAPGLLAGLLFSVEFLLLFVALAISDAGRVMVLLYTAPFVVALGGRFLPHPEPLTPLRWAGIGVAFLGTVVLMAPRMGGRESLVGDLLALGAGICWGLTTIVIKGSSLARAAPLKVVLYQLVSSAAFLVAASLVAGEAWAVPKAPLVWFSILYQAIWVGAVTFAIWFTLVQRYPPARLSVLTFMAPIFGVAFGHVFLGEPLGASLIGALSLVTIGIVLVNWPGGRAPA